MTTWRYYETKKHGKMLDRVGLPVSDTPSRDKIDSSSLEHLIDVITSSHIIKDLPFGQNTSAITGIWRIFENTQSDT